MSLNATVPSLCPGLKVGPCYSRQLSSLRYVPIIHVSAKYPQFRSLPISCQARKVPAFRAGSLPFAQSSSSFLYGEHGNAFKMPSLARSSKMRPRSAVVVAAAASKTKFIYPPMTTKPKWWWRTIACTPYLLPLHLIWLHADSAYHLHPFLQNWDFLVNPFLDTLALMPNWMMMVLVFSAYYLVVRNKEWPHFVRFHVIMAMLLENACQAIAIACTWLPKFAYRGTVGTHIWLAVAFVQLYTVIECMRCAITGKYADVPFVSDSAYIHSDPKMF